MDLTPFWTWGRIKDSPPILMLETRQLVAEWEDFAIPIAKFLLYQGSL